MGRGLLVPLPKFLANGGRYGNIKKECQYYRSVLEEAEKKPGVLRRDSAQNDIDVEEKT